MAILGIKFDRSYDPDGGGQDEPTQYNGVRLALGRPGEEVVFNSGNLIQDWNAALERYRQEIKTYPETWLLLSSSVHDYLVGDDVEIQYNEDTGIMEPLGTQGENDAI